MKNDEDIKQIIKRDLEKLDSLFSASVPDVQLIEQHIKLEQVKLRKKFIRQLLLFVCLAIFMISITLLLINELPIVYLIIQGTVLLIFLINYFVFRRKQVSVSE